MTVSDLDSLPYRLNVGLMLVNSDGRIFAGRRIDYPEAWQMPQGGIDEGEDARSAALRELQEETGIAANDVDILAESRNWHSYEFPPEVAAKLWRGGYRGQKQRWFLLRFNGNDSSVNIATAEPEFEEWRWMDPDELQKRIVSFKRHIYQSVMQEFAGLY